MNRKALLSVVLLVLSFFPVIGTVYSEGEDTANVPFELQFHYPDNHVPSTVGYYDLNLGKGESQNLSVTIKNNQDSEMLIDILPVDCYTHPSGELYYDKNPNTDKVAITDNNFKWSDNISVQSQVYLPPYGSYDLPFTITVPQVDEGEVISGLNFSTEVKSASESDQAESSDVASFSFVVRKSITMAIRVNIATPASLATPSIVFGDVSFDAQNSRIYYDLENKLPVINNGIKGDYEVLTSENASIFNGTFDLNKMAPKTAVKVPVPWNAGTLEKGQYLFKINIQADGTTYSFEKSFKITQGDINTYSNTARVQSVINSNSPLQTIGLLIIILFLAIIAFLLYLILIKGRRRQEIK